MDTLFYLLLPFIELGPSYYLSVGTLLAVVTLVRFHRTVTAGLAAHWPLASLVLFMVPSLLTGLGSDMTQDALRVGREALVASLLIAILAGADDQPGRVSARALMRLSILFLGVGLLLVMVQYLALARGRYLGLPQAWYAQGTGTIANDLALKYSHLRPSATFSEPSYLSFVTLSLVFMLLPARDMKRSFALLAAIAVAIGALCQAASFVMFACLIGAVHIYQRADLAQRMILVPAGLVLFVLLVALGSDVGPVARVLQGGSISGDYSIFVRIFGPAQILPGFLWDHPAGIPFASLPDVLAPYTSPLGIPVEEFLHNSLFNLLFEYGLLGVFPMIALFRRQDATVRAYLLSCMLFNGAFLSFDKLAVVGFAVSAYCALRRRQDLIARFTREDDARRRAVLSVLSGLRTPRGASGAGQAAST